MSELLRTDRKSLSGGCNKNPRDSCHCLHTETHVTRDGIACFARCCWCNYTTEQRVALLPEHGEYERG